MKNFKISLNIFLMLLLFLSSCQDRNNNSPNSFENESFLFSKKITAIERTAITESLRILNKDLFGNPNIDLAEAWYYEGAANPVFHIPLDKGQNIGIRDNDQIGLADYLFVSFNDDMTESIPVVHRFELYNNDTPENTNGKTTVYKISGETLISSDIVEGQLVNLHNEQGTQNVADSVWGCFSDCMGSAWDNLSWYNQLACGSAFGACVWSGNPYACLTGGVCVASAYSACAAGALTYCG